jgi:ABC-type multidrug transport system ATPase subunit
MIEARHVAYRYHRRRWGLVDANFAVDGSAVGVLGPNGAGKSTLLSLLTGARMPTSGSLSLNDLHVDDPAQRRQLQAGMGFVPQSLSVYPHYTVEDFLTYVAWLRRVPSADLSGNIRDSLGATDLSDLRDRKIRTLSGGMRQRVILAQALVNRPSVVVLDEPTIGLDPEQRAHFVGKIAELRDRTRIVLATHLVEDVAALCDQIVVLAEGNVAFHGSTDEFVAQAGPTVGADAAGINAAYLAVLQKTRTAAAGRS